MLGVPYITGLVELSGTVNEELINQISGYSYLEFLKEYYEIVGESRPLSVFFPKHADFFTEMHF